MFQNPPHVSDQDLRSPLLPRATESAKTELDEQPRKTINELFRTFSNGTARVVGTPWAFLAAVLMLIAWGFSYRMFVSGPPGSSEHEKGFDTWQLVINTITTIVTFLMVFLIQNTQNRDAKAIHLKLDELIRSVHGARNRLVNLQDMTDEELDRLQREFQRIHSREVKKATNGESIPSSSQTGA